MADAWIEETLPQTISTLTTQQPFKSQFSALTTNADRVQFCHTQKEVQRWVGLFMSKFSVNRTGSKCSTTAGKFREKGNDHFREHKYESAIQLYSRAICFAPQTVGETASELALAFGNRSAAYFQLGQHDNALKDANVALALGYGQFKSATKLQLRKCDCLIRLGRASEAEELLHFMQKPTGDENDTKRWIELFGRISLDDDKKKEKKKKKKNKKKGAKKNDDSNPKASNVSLISKLTNKGLFKSSEKMSSFSTKVAVQYDEVKGRHLVAKEDIEFGDILAVSRPYVTLLDSKNDVLKHCHHCCRDLLESISPIPCTDCSSVVYCSEECRTESVNSYHRYECGQTDLLVQLPKFARMSLRLLYRAGMDQIRSVVNSVSVDASHISEQAEGHYSHVYQLVHHSDGPLKDLNMSYQEMLISSIMVCLLLQLAKKSNFQMSTKKEEKLIGGILLRQLLQSHYNTFDYSPLYKESQILGGVGSPSSVLLDLYPLYASTLNYSCKANALLKSPNNQHVCLQAAQSISVGTEITIPYLGGDAYDPNNPSTSAPELFEDRYFVSCFCTQCTYHSRNTPFGVSAAYLALSCSACGYLMELSSEHKSESEVFRCTNCQLTMTNAEMKRRYRVFGQLGISFFELSILICRSEERPVWKMLKIVEQLETLLHRNSLELGIFHSTLARHYRLTHQMGKVWSCLEQFLSIYGRSYGKESVVFLEALELVQEAVLNVTPMMMELFEQQDSELYQRYLARMEQLKQLKRKYYPDY